MKKYTFLYFSILVFVVFVIIVSVYVFTPQITNVFDQIFSAQTQSTFVLNALRTFLKTQERHPITMLFVGDVMMTRGVGMKIKGAHNPLFPFLHIQDRLQKADFTFANLEGPISERGMNQGSIYSFRMKPEVLEGLKFAGFDMLSVANNHIWDWGVDALSDTLTLLKQNNIISLGAGMNEQEANEAKMVNVGALRVGFLGCTTLYPKNLEAFGEHPGVSHCAQETLESEIRALRPQVDVVIVSLHWGEEYQTRSNKNQQMMARRLIDAGADLIVGHHPHVTQEVERYQNGWIAYSLGNFVFDQDFSDETMRGMMLEVIAENNHIREVNPIAIQLNSDFQPEVNAGILKE